MKNETKEKKEEDGFEKIIKECEEKRDEYLKGWQRERADYSNYKKDEIKKIEEERLRIKINFLKNLLPIYDSLNEAKKITGNEEVLNQLENFLKDWGARKIKTIGEKFDPEIHEALETIESDKESGTIIEEMQGGWKIDKYLIRPARVKIAK
ncbi:MAG: nucleotide exchange factor GrpE [Parcubacteria group bacterium]|nr:nucleotide exchange factor GrpE [Parcubacteria group bacterium]